MNDVSSHNWLVHAQISLQQMVEQAKVSKSRESYNLRKYRNLYSQVSAALTSRGVLH